MHLLTVGALWHIAPGQGGSETKTCSAPDMGLLGLNHPLPMQTLLFFDLKLGSEPHTMNLVWEILSDLLHSAPSPRLFLGNHTLYDSLKFSRRPSMPEEGAWGAKSMIVRPEPERRRPAVSDSGHSSSLAIPGLR